MGKEEEGEILHFSNVGLLFLSFSLQPPLFLLLLLLLFLLLQSNTSPELTDSANIDKVFVAKS